MLAATAALPRNNRRDQFTDHLLGIQFPCWRGSYHLALRGRRALPAAIGLNGLSRCGKEMGTKEVGSRSETQGWNAGRCR